MTLMPVDVAPSVVAPPPRQDWTRSEIAYLFDLPFDALMYQAQTTHRAHHAAGEVQLCRLLSIKTGGCPEDCGYCSQSAGAKIGLKAEKLMSPLCWPMPLQQKPPGRSAFAWGRRGATPRTATCPPSLRWSRAFANLGWKPA